MTQVGPGDSPVTALAPSDRTVVTEWQEEFAAAARRSLRIRMKYGFIRTYRPVLDDAPYRAFDTLSDYRRWCETDLPGWLGYARL